MQLEEIRGRRKTRRLAVTRGALYAFLKYETDLTTTEIGKLMHRSHSTIVNVGNDYHYKVTHPRFIGWKFDYIREAYENIKRAYQTLKDTVERGNGNLAGGTWDDDTLQGLLLQYELPRWRDYIQRNN